MCSGDLHCWQKLDVKTKVSQQFVRTLYGHVQVGFGTCVGNRCFSTVSSQKSEHVQVSFGSCVGNQSFSKVSSKTCGKLWFSLQFLSETAKHADKFLQTLVAETLNLLSGFCYRNHLRHIIFNSSSLRGVTIQHFGHMDTICDTTSGIINIFEVEWDFTQTCGRAEKQPHTLS